MAFVSVTRLRLRAWRFFPSFFWHATRSRMQARRTDGHLAIAVRGARDGVFWTLTIWRDQAAMRAFMLNGAHRKAMPHLQEWCDEASVAHWEQTETTLPTWREAMRRMAANGRLTPVKHPSPAQAAGKLCGGDS